MPKEPTTDATLRASARQNKLTLRRNQACHQCRRRKMRCDARKPVCTTCARSHLHLKLHPQAGVVLPDVPDCTFDDLPEPEEHPSKRIEFLERRVQELEGLLNQSQKPQAPPTEMEQSIFVQTDNVLPDPRLHLGFVAGTSSARDEVDLGAYTMSNSGMGSSPGSSSSSSPSVLFDHTGAELLVDSWPQDLPSIDIVNKCLEAFFAYHPHARRLLHQQVLLQSLSFPTSHPGFPSAALLHAICGLGSVMQVVGMAPADGPDLAHLRRVAGFAERQLTMARSRAQDDILAGVRLLQAQQALLICGWWFWCNARWVEVFSISSQILRSCLPLGLHMSSAYHPITDAAMASLLPQSSEAIELETRRNVFWLAYALERQSGSAHGWPSTLDDIDISQLFPVSAGTFAMGFSWPPDEQRQNPFTANVFLTHSSEHIDGFGLWIKGTMLLSRIKNYNMRYRQRVTLHDPRVLSSPDVDCIPEWGNRPGVEDTRRNPDFVELDQIGMKFEESFAIRIALPVTRENFDMYLYTATLMPYVALIILHDPHAHVETMACLSTRRLLYASRRILQYILDVYSSEIQYGLIDQFCHFAWFMAGKTLTRFWQVAIHANAQNQVDIFRAEVQQIITALMAAGKFAPLPKRYSVMLSEHAARMCGDNLLVNTVISG